MKDTISTVAIRDENILSIKYRSNLLILNELKYSKAIFIRIPFI